MQLLYKVPIFCFLGNLSTSTNEQPASGGNTAGFDTGGGFSVNNPMPDYQKNAGMQYEKFM